MIAYKKQRRKVDPVKQILARLEEKQSKSGLSLYSRDDGHEPGKEDVLPMVKPFTDASACSKKSPFFPNLSAARQKAHRRLNAGLKHSIDESDRKAALYAQTKADRRLNLTFPPVNAHHTTRNVNHGRQSYAFSSWSDSPSAGVENLRNSHYTSMNPFGYSRRTLAFQPTSLNYVVEWPETWPLKIMSIGKGTGRLHKRKPAKPKPQDYHRVHFESSPTPCTSPREPKNGITKQTSATAMAAPPQNQANQVLQEIQPPQISFSTNRTLQQLPSSEKIQHEKQEEQVPSRGEDVNENFTSNLLEAGDRNSTENSRLYSDTSSLSESVYVGTYEDKTGKVPDETENYQADGTTKLSGVPTCSPTSKNRENEPNGGEGGDLQECKGGEGKADSQSLLMEIVSEIAAEPGVDYMQNI